jgi:hypothetical protein
MVDALLVGGAYSRLPEGILIGVRFFKIFRRTMTKLSLRCHEVLSFRVSKSARMGKATAGALALHDLAAERSGWGEYHRGCGESPSCILSDYRALSHSARSWSAEAKLPPWPLALLRRLSSHHGLCSRALQVDLEEVGCELEANEV